VTGWSVLRDLERRGFLHEQCSGCQHEKAHHDLEPRRFCHVCWSYCAYSPAFVPRWTEDNEPWCDTAIAHGPGHQSVSPCTEIGEHEVHRYEDFAWEDKHLREGKTWDGGRKWKRWDGRTYRLAFSGGFDESPSDE
jgi:hypothetical protein